MRTVLACLLPIAIFLVSCGSGPEVAEPKEVVGQQQEVRDSLQLGPSAELVDLFAGCYEIELGERFQRPIGWPHQFTLRLSGEPGHLAAWRAAKSSMPSPHAPDWTASDSRTAMVSWRMEGSQHFQLLLRAEPPHFVAISTSKERPIEARSVRRFLCT